MKKQQIALLLAGCVVLTACGSNRTGGGESAQAAASEGSRVIFAEDLQEEICLPKETGGNPITGRQLRDLGESSDYLYGGDPSALVDGDTVYLFTGADVSTDHEVEQSIYNIPEYRCYSSTDLSTWSYEGVVMTMDTVTWAKDDSSAWASQVVKHYDAEQGRDLYYLYFCTWDKSGKQSIGVATAESPTGPFTDMGEALVRGSQTKPDTTSYNDIDPTVWIETDEEGTEHRYLAWGNGVFFVCELNEDMVSVTDRNGDGEISCGLDGESDDIVKRTIGLEDYTEAPWLYRRTDESGRATGPYYLFFAHRWRECLAYATCEDLFTGAWSDTRMIMTPTATSNTNHPAVIDYQGTTYLIGHNGALPAGSGFRRSVTIQEMTITEDGSIAMMEETASGLTGNAVMLTTADDRSLSHESFVSSTADGDYPYQDIGVGTDIGKSKTDALWVLRPGKSDFANDASISMESENKPGLYLTARDDGSIVLAQDTDATEQTAKAQTFRTMKYGDGFVLESIAQPGRYVGVADEKACLTDGSDAEILIFTLKLE